MRLFHSAAMALAIATPASATTITDATGDLLSSFTGMRSAALDIVAASAVFDGTTFTLDAMTAGAIGLPGSLYVFGINCGAGTDRLTLGTPSIGAGIQFDAVAVLFPDGTGRIATFPAAGLPVITTLPGAVTVSGSTITGAFAASLLPSTGFAPSAYQFSQWSRLRVNPAMDGTNAEIADFAPNASSFAVSSVPEPGAWLMLLGGFGAVGASMRRRRVRFQPALPRHAAA